MPLSTQIISALVGIFATLSAKISRVVVLGAISNLNTDIDIDIDIDIDFEPNADESYRG